MSKPKKPAKMMKNILKNPYKLLKLLRNFTPPPPPPALRHKRAQVTKGLFSFLRQAPPISGHRQNLPRRRSNSTFCSILFLDRYFLSKLVVNMSFFARYLVACFRNRPSIRSQNVAKGELTP